MVFRRLEMRAGICFALVISPLFAAAAWGQAAPADGQSQAAGSPVAAEPAKPEEKKEEAKPATPAAQPKPYEAILKEFKPVQGLIPLYHKDIRLIGELSEAHLNKDLIVIISIAKGISQRPLLGGMSWGFGDDWIWQFRRQTTGFWSSAATSGSVPMKNRRKPTLYKWHTRTA
jgi:hypothetical protein